MVYSQFEFSGLVDSSEVDLTSSIDSFELPSGISFSDSLLHLQFTSDGKIEVGLTGELITVVEESKLFNNFIY